MIDKCVATDYDRCFVELPGAATTMTRRHYPEYHLAVVVWPDDKADRCEAMRCSDTDKPRFVLNVRTTDAMMHIAEGIEIITRWKPGRLAITYS